MKRHIKWFLGGAVAVALTVGVVAQSLAPTSLTGNEAWSCAIGGPGGPSIFCTTALMRNATGYQLFTTTVATTTATTLATRYIYAYAATTVTLGTPIAPLDGEMLEIVNGTGTNFSGTITLNASAGQTVNNGSVTNLGSNSSKEWQYVATSTPTWYSLR